MWLAKEARGVKEMKLGNVFALVLVSAAVATAQQPTPQPAFTNEVRVNNVTVDVKVVGPDGTPVTSLRREDFRIFEDGAEQDVTNFLAVHGGEVSAAQDGGLVGASAPRQVVIFFDLYQLLERDKNRVVASLRQQLAGGLPPAMTVGVASFDGVLRVHTAPTASAARVLEALNEVERTSATGLQRQITLASFGTWGLPSGDEENGDPHRRLSDPDYRRVQNAEFWTELRRIVERVELAFTAGLQRFADTRARKLALFVSPGLPRTRRLPVFRVNDFWSDQPPEYSQIGFLGRIAQRASEMEYTLYALDPSSPRIEGGDADIGALPLASQAGASSFWMEADRKDDLIKAARFTGGEALFTPDGAAALADVERLTASYYSLAFQPDHAGDDREHTIRVSVRDHPEYTLTYRTRYIDRPFEERDAERARAALLTGETANPLGVVLVMSKPKRSFRLGASGLHVFRLPVEVRIPYAELTLVPRGPVATGQLQVVMLVVDAHGNQSRLGRREVPVQLPVDKVEEARTRGYFSFEATLELEGGERSVRVAVEDKLAHTTSTVTANVHL
jgi:VWFA-related protein